MKSSPLKQIPPKSPFLAPRRISSGKAASGSEHELAQSPFSITSRTTTHSTCTERTTVEPEHKSTLMGCTANLITAILGAGIIGIPYAMKETGLVAGVFLILFSGAVGCKSLRLLVETSRYIDATSYETLCEAVFGQIGWIVCNVNMFLMSWGPMLSYMMIVKDTAGVVWGYSTEAGQKMILIVCSVGIMLPLSLQRASIEDMADLAKTSRICVLFDIFLVAMIAYYSPTSESIQLNDGLLPILYESSFRPRTCFIGLGIISFAFSCQHSSLIIAGSLEDLSVVRWQKVTAAALGICSILALFMGVFGYVGFLESTEGDVFNNFPYPDETSSDDATATAINFARGVLCGVMFFVYPLESFVARHVIMTNLFQGRDAHEGDDHAVLDRWDRRWITTIVLFLSVLIPALYFSDVGLVLAFTGTVAATTLTYLLPGALFIGVHADDFLELVKGRWGSSIDHCTTYYDCITWYLFLIPIWYQVASVGKRSLAFYNEKKALQTPSQSYRLGKIRHRYSPVKKSQPLCDLNISSKTVCNESSEIVATASSRQIYDAISTISSCTEEYDPQGEKKSNTDFVIAIGFVGFGIIALASGILSIIRSLSAD